MCDGQAAVDCDLMNLTEFEVSLNSQLTKLNDQFARIDEVLRTKKEALIQISRSDPRICHDEAVMILQTTIESFNPMNPEKVLGNLVLESVTLRIRRYFSLFYLFISKYSPWSILYWIPFSWRPSSSGQIDQVAPGV